MADPQVALLPRASLVKTSALDQAAWNFVGGMLSAIRRKRFALATRLLGAGHGDLLEIGYGSGVFMPELAARCDRLYGVDVHDHTGAVTNALAAAGVTARLEVAPAERLPFADDRFDAVVAVSSLEFVDDVAQAVAEMAWVLRPGGVAVVVTPGYSPMVDLGLRVLSGERAEDTFQRRRQLVVSALMGNFRVERSLRYPVIGTWLYTALRCQRRGA
jgi:SAM-dependent methyltransferase